MSAGGLASTDYVPFFQAMWGFAPFPWQERLLTRLVTGTDANHSYAGLPGLWPDVLNLPTGSGKTAALTRPYAHCLCGGSSPGRR
jgi:CRISPR-associated endonuclease/helicase Cas3